MKVPVEMHSHWKAKVVRGSDPFTHLMRERVAGFGFVRDVAEEVEIFDAGFAFLPKKMVTAVGVEIVAFFGQAGG